MRSRKLTGLDYLMIGFSVVFFGAAVGALAMGWYLAAIGLFCVFGCVLLILLQRQLVKPEPKVYEQPDYQELVQKMAASRRVSEVQLNLMKTKLQEKEHELQKYIRLYGAAGEEKGVQSGEMPGRAAVLDGIAGKEREA